MICTSVRKYGPDGKDLARKGGQIKPGGKNPGRGDPAGAGASGSGGAALRAAMTTDPEKIHEKTV